MANIISLSGPPDSGKSTTIQRLFDELPNHGYIIVQNKKRPNSHDFFVILKKNKDYVGVTSYGDSVAILRARTNYFITNGCTYIVCACRERGSSTYDFVRNIPGSSVAFVIKTIATSSNQYASVNDADVRILLTHLP